MYYTMYRIFNLIRYIRTYHKNPCTIKNDQQYVSIYIAVSVKRLRMHSTVSYSSNGLLLNCDQSAPPPPARLTPKH